MSVKKTLVNANIHFKKSLSRNVCVRSFMNEAQCLFEHFKRDIVMSLTHCSILKSWEKSCFCGQHFNVYRNSRLSFVLPCVVDATVEEIWLSNMTACLCQTQLVCYLYAF